MEKRLLMPKSTAIWLIEHTTLTFEQIANFCGLHIVEIEAIADGDAAQNMIGTNPVEQGQLTREEIRRCELDTNAALSLNTSEAQKILSVKKKYTPLAKRKERPDCILWLLKYYPQLTEIEICYLVGTTKKTILSIKEKTHVRQKTLSPKDPVLLGFCTKEELERAKKRCDSAG